MSGFTFRSSPKVGAEERFVGTLDIILRVAWLGLLLGIAFWSGPLRAAETYSPKLFDAFELPWQWSEIEGLDIGRTREFDVGRDGTLWLGVIGELFSYDGHELRSHGKPSAESQSSFRSLKVVASGKVYVVIGRSLYAWDGSVWTEVESALPAARGPRLEEDSLGRLWLAAGNRVAQIEGEAVRWRDTEFVEPIGCLSVDPEGRFWLVGAESGTVALMSLRGDGFATRKRWPGLLAAEGHGGEPGSLLNHKIEALSDGSVWAFSNHDGIAPRSLASGGEDWIIHDLEKLGGSNRNDSLLETSDGRIYITGAEAIHRFDGANWRIFDGPELRLTRNRSILKEAPNGDVWLFERFVRIARIDYSHSRWTAFRDLAYQGETADGSQWFLEQSRRVARRSPSGDAWTLFDHGDGLAEEILALFVRKDGSLWAFGSSGGVAAASVWRGDDWETRLFPELGSAIVRDAMGELSDGRLFVCGRPDNQAWNHANNSKIALFPAGLGGEPEIVDLPVPYLRGLGELPDGRISLGGRYLMSYDDAAAERLVEIADQPFITWLSDLEIGGDGAVWVASWSMGIGRFKDGEWSYYDKSNGLSSSYVSDLFTLENGQLAALTAEGLDRFDGESWYRMDLAHFGGVRDGSFIEQSDDGALWLSVASSGWFRDESLSETQDYAMKTLRYLPGQGAPDTRFEMSSEVDRHVTSLVLAWSGSDLWNQAPAAALTYSFRVDGGPWSPFKSDRMTVLPDLQPGLLTVEVRARDNEGNVDPTPAVFEMRIAAYFWETPWFIGSVVACALLIAGLIYALLIQRIRHVTILDRTRGHFLTNISHELRSPLTLIIGPLEKLVETKELSELGPVGRSVEKCSAIALRNAKRLNQLIDQLLEVRRLETEPINLNPEPCELVGLTRVTAADFDNLAQAEGQRVRFSANRDAAWLAIDKDAYRKILNNILMNALKYSGKGATTQLRLEIEAGEGENHSVRLVLEDEGIGIAKDVLPHVFEPFYCGAESKLSDVRSFGIGLALVKELVVAHGGTVLAESPIRLIDGKHGGARFSVLLPHVARSEPLASDASEVIPLRFATAPEIDQDREIILVVDDQVEILEFLTQELGSAYQVLSASDGKAALEMALEVVPSLVLADVSMPEMDGFELCEKLRSSQATSHIPVLLQSAFPAEERRRLGFEAGALDFIAKPLSISNLKLRIRNVLDIRDSQAQQLKARLVSEADATSPEDVDLEGAFLAKVRAVLESEMGNSEFTTQRFAAELGLSRSACYRKFKALVNLSPTEFIKNCRLERAAKLLAQGMTAAEVSGRVGYV